MSALGQTWSKLAAVLGGLVVLALAKGPNPEAGLLFPSISPAAALCSSWLVRVLSVHLLASTNTSFSTWLARVWNRRLGMSHKFCIWAAYPSLWVVLTPAALAPRKLLLRMTRTCLKR